MSCLVFLPHLDATAWEFILSCSLPPSMFPSLPLSFSLTDALANGKSTIGSQHTQRCNLHRMFSLLLPVGPPLNFNLQPRSAFITVPNRTDSADMEGAAAWFCQCIFPHKTSVLAGRIVIHISDHLSYPKSLLKKESVKSAPSKSLTLPYRSFRSHDHSFNSNTVGARWEVGWCVYIVNCV